MAHTNSPTTAPLVKLQAEIFTFREINGSDLNILISCSFIFFHGLFNPHRTINNTNDKIFMELNVNNKSCAQLFKIDITYKTGYKSYCTHYMTP